MKRTTSRIVAVLCIFAFLIAVPSSVIPSAAAIQAPALSCTSAQLVTGQTLTLKVKHTTKKVTWYSSKAAIASVNASGKVTAKKAGKVIITAKTGAKKMRCTITVIKKSAYIGRFGYITPPSHGNWAGSSLIIRIYKISGNRITFSIGYNGINASPLYATGVITATLHGSKASFHWTDSWFNAGTGSLWLKSNKHIALKMVQTKTASFNRYSFARDKTVYSKLS